MSTFVEDHWDAIMTTVWIILFIVLFLGFGIAPSVPTGSPNAL